MHCFFLGKVCFLIRDKSSRPPHTRSMAWWLNLGSVGIRNHSKRRGRLNKTIFRSFLFYFPSLPSFLLFQKIGRSASLKSINRFFQSVIRACKTNFRFWKKWAYHTLSSFIRFALVHGNEGYKMMKRRDHCRGPGSDSPSNVDKVSQNKTTVQAWNIYTGVNVFWQ